MTRIENAETLAKTVANLEARTPRLEAAVATRQQAVTDSAIAAAQGSSEEDRKKLRDGEAAIMRELDQARLVLDGHRLAVDEARARLATAKNAEELAKRDAEDAVYHKEARDLFTDFMKAASNLDALTDELVAAFKSTREKFAAFFNFYQGSISSEDKGYATLQMAAQPLLGRIALRATLQGVPFTKTMLDPTTAALPTTVQPLLQAESLQPLLSAMRTATGA